MVFFISNNYYIYLKRYFENIVTKDFFRIFWSTAALKGSIDVCIKKTLPRKKRNMNLRNYKLNKKYLHFVLHEATFSETFTNFLERKDSKVCDFLRY